MNLDRKQNDNPPIKDDDRPNEPQNHGDDNNYAYRDFSHVKYSDVSHGSKQESSSRKLPARLYAMLKDPGEDWLCLLLSFICINDACILTMPRIDS